MAAQPRSAGLPAPGPLRRIRGSALTKGCGRSARTLPARRYHHHSDSGKPMNKRIDARGDIEIADLSGDAVRGERTALTAAHRTRECYVRCVPRLARLRLLAGDSPGAPLPPGAAGEVGQAARAIVAETGAAGQAAVAAVAEGRRGSAAAFLAVRQARLVAAADDVAVAAEDGSAAALSRPLRRFEALTTALWTVQSDLRTASPPPASGPGRTGSLIRTPDCGPAGSGP